MIHRLTQQLLNCLFATKKLHTIRNLFRRTKICNGRNPRQLGAVCPFIIMLVMKMLRDALNAGIKADYLLMDTWFTNEPFIKNVLDVGLDIIGMLKNNQQMYHYKGKLYNLNNLATRFARMNVPDDILGSVVVRTRREHIPAKIVFVRNHNKRSEYIMILSTDCSLSDGEIIRRYGYHWSIECCFKVCKSLLKLGKEFQPVNYDTTISSTALVFTRYILLEWIRRNNSDFHTLGEIFFFCT